MYILIVQVFDNNGDGMISVGDMRMSLSHLGETLPMEMLEELVREVDQNGEGQVSIEGTPKIATAVATGKMIAKLYIQKAILSLYPTQFGLTSIYYQYNLHLYYIFNGFFHDI